jgi:hypothetical protein
VLEKDEEKEPREAKPWLSLLRSVDYSGGPLGQLVETPIGGDGFILRRAAPRPVRVVVTTIISAVGPPAALDLLPPALEFDSKYLLSSSPGRIALDQGKSKDATQDVYTHEIVRTYVFPPGEEPEPEQLFSLVSHDFPDGGWATGMEWKL